MPWQGSFIALQTGYSSAYLILTCSLIFKHWPSIWWTIFHSCYFLVGKSQFQWVINLIRFNMDIENKIRKISHLTSKVLYLYKAMICFEGTFMLKNCWKLKVISWKIIINRWKVYVIYIVIRIFILKTECNLTSQQKIPKINTIIKWYTNVSTLTQSPQSFTNLSIW